MGKKMNKEKKDDILYTVLTLLLGVAMIAAGLFGVVSSRIESKEYKNSAYMRSPQLYTAYRPMRIRTITTM